VGDVEAAVRDYLAGVYISAERIQALRQVILDSFAGKHEQGRAEIERQKQRLIQLEQRRQKAKAAYYADVLDLDEFKREQATIKQDIRAAEDSIARWSVELDGIRQALDEALQLVADPQALYDALPEGLRVQLIRALFEKIWVLDLGVVGSDLTEPFAELLTLDARLTWTSQQVQQAMPGAAPPAPAEGIADIEGRAYYRMRETVPIPRDALEGLDGLTDG
jgi:hypothetical protein